MRKRAAGTIIFQILVLSMILCPQIAFSAGGGDWVVVDGIVATIKNVPVLRSDVQMEADFGLLKAENENAGFDSLLGSYLNRLLILKELEDIGGFRLAEGQAENAYRQYLAEYKDKTVYKEKLRRWGIDETEIFRRMQRALLASLYTESRIKFFIKVIPSDIEKAYKENPGRWGNVGLYEAWEKIKAYLTEQEFKREKDRWLATLRQRYDLVIPAPVKGPP